MYGPHQFLVILTVNTTFVLIDDFTHYLDIPTFPKNQTFCPHSFPTHYIWSFPLCQKSDILPILLSFHANGLCRVGIAQDRHGSTWPGWLMGCVVSPLARTRPISF
jgi:hypothetical protein